MEIKGKVHCFFEQSGTFKNEFVKLGIRAEDYDIQDNFGQTDHVVDLFAEIENGWDGKPSLFDSISKDDLVLAFFPCIYFCAMSQMAFFWTYTNYRNKTIREKTDLILKRAKDREKFFSLAVKMLGIAKERGIRLIMENPWSEQTYLKANFVAPPTLVDMDRRKRGDSFKKPTAYWYVNCEPTYGESYQKPEEEKTILSTKMSPQAGVCSEERSMICPDYARNFIKDFVLGEERKKSLLDNFAI